MAGHSKWANIQHRKGRQDEKRGKIWTRVIREITVAARTGGGDPAMNPRLRLAIEKAKAANMPVANIQRAIDRVGDKNAAAMEEATYEAYGPGGIGIIIETATDNKNRTYPEVRTALTKNGGTMAEPGSVAFQFTRKGVIRVEAGGEDALLTVLDAGADDAIEEDGGMTVYTDQKDLAKVRAAIVEAGLAVNEAELQYVPNAMVEISDPEVARKALKVLDALDDLDDVVNVHTNADITVEPAA